MYDVIIVGSGPSGLTAAIYATRAELKTLVISGLKWGGQLMLTTEVENFPGFPEGIQGPELMMNMRKQAEKFGAVFVDSDMDPVDLSSQKGGPFTVTASGNSYTGKTLLIATGADAKTLGVVGEKELIGRGISYCATCDGAFFRNKNIMVVGGGDSAMEEATFLTNFASSVTIVHRRDEFKASPIMVEKAKANPKIKFLLNSQITEVLGTSHVEKVKVKTLSPVILNGSEGSQFKGVIPAKAGIQENGSRIKSGMTGFLPKNDSREEITEHPIDGIFVAIGHTPNTKVFGGINVTERGYVKPEMRTATNIQGVFVSGDVQDDHYQQAITAAGFGCMAALDIQSYISDRE